jgi:cytochrome c oxidase subunit 2
VEPGVIRWGRHSVSPLRTIPRRTNRRRRLAPLAGVLGLVLLATTGCQSNAVTRLGMPVPVTKQGQAVLTLWQGSWIAAWAVGILVWAAIIWAVLFYRKRSDRVPHQVRYNLPIEILYTVVPFIMVGVLFYFTARDENYIDKLSARPSVVVNVTGFQWGWKFDYPQFKVSAGPGDVSETGTMWNPGAGSGGLPLLEIPANETVRFNLVSTDVVHAFWIVPFDFKRDVIPGHPNHFEVTPTKTGTWIGRCSELCGVFHSRMLFRVKIVTPAQFQQWINGQQAQQIASGGTQ